MYIGSKYIHLFWISFELQIYATLSKTIYNATFGNKTFGSINEWTINGDVARVPNSYCPSGLDDSNACMEVKGQGTATLAIPLTNYHSISISTEQVESVSGGDWCYLEYTTDSIGVWTNAISMTNGNIESNPVVQLPNDATINGQSSFQIRIRNTGGGSNDKCYYDNLQVEGTLSTSMPTSQPTFVPTYNPTNNPTLLPTTNPTNNPTLSPTHIPTYKTQTPSYNPITSSPTYNPTTAPTYNPTSFPSIAPSNPTYNPTATPTQKPTMTPTGDSMMVPSKDILTTKNMNASVKNNNDSMKMVIVVALVCVLIALILCIIIFIIYKKKKKKSQDNSKQVAAGVIGSENEGETNKIEMISSSEQTINGAMIVEQTKEDSLDDLYTKKVVETKGKINDGNVTTGNLNDDEDSSSAEDMFIQTQQTTMGDDIEEITPTQGP